MNNDGFKNEKLIADKVNKIIFAHLEPNFQNFISYIAKEEGLSVIPSTMISASVIHDNSCKSDIIVSFLNRDFGISIKKGSGNSIHQEKIIFFLDYIETKLSCDIGDLFSWFISDLQYAIELKKEAPENLFKLKQFLDQNKELITKRFLQTGLVKHHHTQYIYYGTDTKGIWASIEKAIRVIISKKSRSTLPMGSLSIQAWNRTNEKKRHVIQAKWTSIESDLKEAQEL
jgi:hypothetical protein